MRCKSSKSIGPTYRGIETFATFLAANAGGRRDLHGKSISSAADSPAKISATPASGPASTGRDPACGRSLPGSFAFFDPATSSWRTCQPSLFEGWSEFSGTWPTSGLMRSGIVSRLPPLVPRIEDGDSSLLLTPTTRDWRSGKASEATLSKNSRPLNEVVQAMYPTPTASEFGCRDVERLMARRKKYQDKYHNNGFGLSLSQHMAVMCTRADGRDDAGGSDSRRAAKKRGVYFGRTLSPLFVEWLMGLPLGWTDLEDSATPSCRRSPSGSAVESWSPSREDFP